MITIEESGMTFGPFSADDCLELEKCQTYKRIETNVRMAEFAVIKLQGGLPAVWIVEAKSSAPQPRNQQDFDVYIDEIRQKLANALQLLFSGKLNRHPDWPINLPANFGDLTYLEDFKLVLVIRRQLDAWLPPVQNALKVSLLSTVKTMGLKPNSVVVLNAEMARQYRLIT
jgi:hypothetical protein